MRLTAIALLGLFSALSIAQEPVPGSKEPFPHLGIRALSEELTKLGDAHLIPEQHVSQLQQPLTQSVEALQAADSSQAIQRLNVFKNKVSDQLAPALGNRIVAQASEIQDQITAIASRDLLASIGPCVIPAPDEFQSLTVGPGEALATISDALAFASAEGFDAVEIVLAPAAYREGLITIHRHTRFVAPAGAANIVGGILNNGPYLLELQDVIVTGAAGTGILANNQCAVTILNNVEVQYTEGTGIWQQGGSLTADRLTVVLSNAPDIPSTADRDIGRGLHLSGGVSACMTNVFLDRNDAGALIAEGFLTRVFVSDMLARNNSVSPVVREEIVTTGKTTSGFGSIEIRDEALLLGEWMDVSSSEIAGLVVDNNAHAHIRYSAISRTEDIQIAPFRFVGGVNYLVSSGTLELTSVLSSLSGAGLVVNNVNGGFLKTSTVLVTQNDLGYAVITSSSEESTCAVQCLDGRFERNDRTADFNFLPIPDNGDPPPACPACPAIDFSPSWCNE
ncbi:MAG: hypothetical protein ABFS24_06975 [Pseudomonadota bacterium]